MLLFLIKGRSKLICEGKNSEKDLLRGKGLSMKSWIAKNTSWVESQECLMLRTWKSKQIKKKLNQSWQARITSPGGHQLRTLERFIRVSNLDLRVLFWGDWTSSSLTLKDNCLQDQPQQLRHPQAFSTNQITARSLIRQTIPIWNRIYSNIIAKVARPRRATTRRNKTSSEKQRRRQAEKSNK